MGHSWSSWYVLCQILCPNTNFLLFSHFLNSYGWISGDVAIASIEWLCCHQTEALPGQANDEKR